MHSTRNHLIMTVIFAGLCGCAHIPPVATTYYRPKAETRLVVTRTLACNAERTRLFTATSVEPATSYTSDLGKPLGHVNYDRMDRLFTSANLAVNLTDDGRLAGVNATGSGDAGPALKSAFSMASSFGPRLMESMTLLRDRMPPEREKVRELCDALAANRPLRDTSTPRASGAGDDDTDPLTLTFAIDLGYAGEGGAVLLARRDGGTHAAPPARTIALTPALESEAAYERIRRFLPAEMFTVTLEREDPLANKQAEWTDRDRPADENLVVTLNTVSLVHLELDAVDDDLTGVAPLWRGAVAVPTDGDYDVPVPLPQWFGNEKFAMSLTGYGSIANLEYGKDSGAADATDLAASTLTTLAGAADSSSQYAAQSRTALISSQQRAVRCLATPSTCHTDR
jgi:hypothetical protein